jgi:hypothetical protein
MNLHLIVILFRRESVSIPQTFPVIEAEPVLAFARLPDSSTIWVAKFPELSLTAAKFTIQE